MIPSFNQSGVLPPFLPQSSPVDDAAMAPYKASLMDVATRFGNTPERKAILVGLLDFRRDMKHAGITDGFQWIDGSFFEDCEGNQNRPPNDIDVVTFAKRPVGVLLPQDWAVFVNTNRHLFTRSTTKVSYRCDAYYVDLTIPPETLVSRARYWFGLFSHQRSTYLWKGMVEVSLSDDEGAVRRVITGGSNAP